MQAASPTELMQYVIAQVARVTAIDHVKVMRYRRARGDLLVEAGVGWKAGVVGHAVLAADFGSPAGPRIADRRPGRDREYFGRAWAKRVDQTFNQ
jgi:hypothetical protein